VVVGVPVTLAELRDRLANITNLTATYSRDEVRDAINYGYGKILRAIHSVNAEQFVTFRDNFTFVGAESEHDISDFFPPVGRLTKLVVPGIPANSGTSQNIVSFRYRDFRSADFESAEAMNRGGEAGVVYDIMTGRIPQRNTAVPTAAGTAEVAVQVDYDSFRVVSPISGGIYFGQPISIPGVGPPHWMDADGESEPTVGITSDYLGTVSSFVDAGGYVTIGVTPRMSLWPAVGAWIQLYRTRMLMIAPVFSASVTGRLYYVYHPSRLVKDTETLDPVASEHADALIAYAASWLLRSSNDGQAERWYLEGQEMRSELMQALDPVADQGSQALGSAFDWMRDY